MDKQKQIEEMEKVLYDYRFHYDDCIEGSEPNLAKFLVNRGWIKPAENAVVLTRKEQETHIIMTKINYESIMRQLKQARKETAKEILQKVKSYTLDKEVGMKYLLERLGKEYSVEV